PDGQVGYAFALNPRLGLILTRGPGHNGLTWDQGAWQVQGIQRHEITDANHALQFSVSMIANSLHETYAGDAGILSQAAAILGSTSPGNPLTTPGPGYLVHSEQWLREHEMAYPYYLGLISKPPAEVTEEL